MTNLSEFVKRLAAPLWLGLVLIVLAAGVATAQETTGGLQGTIKDPSGAVVAKAKVVVSGTSLIGAKEVVTDASGYYRFANLPSGAYTIEVSAKGFKASKREGIKIEVGRLPTLGITLEVGAESTTVEVTADAPVVDVTTTQNQTNVSSEQLHNLPTGTSFQSVIQFAPMARNEPLAGDTSNGAGTGGGVPGSSGNGRSVGYSIGGAADSESSYLVEGQDTENVSGGYSKANVPMEFIQEVQVKTSGISAEYGGALGGVINVIMQKGSNEFHGGLFTTYNTSSADANTFQKILRYDPNGTSSTIQDPAYQEYQRKKDNYLNVQPGATLGGPILKNRLWFFGGVSPMITSVNRSVDFTDSTATSGATNTYFAQQSQTYFTNARLDYALNSRVRLFASWLYQYAREEGDNLPTADPIASQSTYLNAAINSPISSYSHDYGWSAPNTTYNFGADITLSDKLVATTRFGYFFENYHDFGWPTSGINLYWGSAASSSTLDNAGNVLPSSLYGSSGASTAAYNDTYTTVNASKHIQFNQDFAYYASYGKWGTHNLRAGYQLNHLSNVINQNGNVPYVRLYPGAGQSESANTSVGGDNCDLLTAKWGYCAGQYGYAYVYDFATVLTTPAVDWNHAFYGQDSWTLGHGVTVDLGLRIEKESLPAPGGIKVSAIDFAWSDKIEPRLGVAWDPTQKGKMKVFGSYGVVNDVMKLLVAQTSWGAQAYEYCYYPLGPNGSGTFNASDIDATFKSGRACPTGTSTTGANFKTGTTPTSFIDSSTGVSLIENVNERPWEPVAPGVKPYRQHEYVAGFDYEIKPGYAVEARYNRRRLDHVIEDASLSDVNNFEMYTIVNPGEGVNSTINGYATYLASLGSSFGVPNYYFDLADFGTCTSCPANPKAVRNYDAFELRLTANPTAHVTAMVSYTYSSLWGNYSGLTSTDQSDGGITGTGRDSPDTTRAFDEPFYYFKADGTSNNGPLPTDRPNVFKGNVYYAHPWNKKHSTTIGLFQNFMQGSPVASFIDLGAGSSSPVESTYIYGRDKWVDMSAAADGTITLGKIRTRRTPWFIQSDVNLAHEIKVGDHKAIKFVFTATNAFNEHSAVAYMEGMGSYNFKSSLRPGGYNMYAGAALYSELEGGYNPGDWINAVTSAGKRRVIMNSEYGQPSKFQTPRTTRFEVHYNF